MKEIAKHVYCVNVMDNGGEAFNITTRYFVNGDRTVFPNQTFSLESYSNCAEIRLTSAALTPAKLRELADLLERLEAMIVEQLKGETNV